MAIRPLPMQMQPRGPAPRMPGSPIGGPGGPGPTAMLSPGASGGAKAAAAAKIKACMRNIQIAGLSFDAGTKEFNAVMGALRTLNGIFGKPSDQDTDAAARAQMAAPPPSPLAGAAPPGAMPGSAPGGAPPGGPATPPPDGGAPPNF